MARVTMLAMHRDGLIVLPPRQYRPKPIVLGHDTEPPLFPAPTTLDDVRPLDCAPSCPHPRGQALERVHRPLHYLGYKTLVGAQMRYAVHDRNGWALAMLGFSTAAWKLAPRDHFIGWTPPLREKNLPLVVTTQGSSSCPGSISTTSARTSSPSCAAGLPGLDRALPHHPRADRDLRRDPALHRRRLQGIGLDPRRGHPGAGATTGTRNVPSRERTSGCDHEKIGSERQSLNPPYPSPHDGTITIFIPAVYVQFRNGADNRCGVGVSSPHARVRPHGGAHGFASLHTFEPVSFR